MKREIKFRLFDGEAKKMFFDTGVIECLKQQIAFNQKTKSFIPYDHEGLHGSTFLEFIGIKDRNNKEIFEGDICNLHSFIQINGDETDSIHKGVVRYDEKYCGFILDIKNGDFIEFWQASDDGIEIIGNIYENPNLLDG